MGTYISACSRSAVAFIGPMERGLERGLMGSSTDVWGVWRVWDKCIFLYLGGLGPPKGRGGSH